MSYYELPHEENAALSLGLDHHILSKVDANLVCNEVEAYYQSIIHKLTELPETKISQLKTKLRSPCKKYNAIKYSRKIQR